MQWIRDYLQSVGIDAVWAVFLIAVALAVGLGAISWFAIIQLQKRLLKIPHDEKQKVSSLVLSALCRIKPALVFIVIFLSVLSQWEVLGPNLPKYVGWIVGVLVVFQIGLVIDGVITPVFSHSNQLKKAPAISSIGLFLTRLLLWIVIVIIVLDNFGIKITALVAGLGVGGIAIALAVKSILEDIFASLTIALDKPFTHGDRLIVGDFDGIVENIGIKTTHVRSVNGELLIFPNNDLLQSRLRNFGRMRERRVVFIIGITYETSPADVKKACKIIEEVISSHEKARLDRVHFLTFNSSSLDIEVVYWVRVPDIKVHVELKQNINLGIFEKFTQAGIEFAYPTQRTVIPAFGKEARGKEEPKNG